jgi:hypothetical protein
MAAVRATPAPEPGGWMSWPFAWQAASLAALVVLALGVVALWPTISATAGFAWTRVADVLGPRTDAIAEFFSPFFTAGRVLWRVIVQPVGLFLVIFIATMGAACAAFGTAWRHVAVGGFSR